MAETGVVFPFPHPETASRNQSSSCNPGDSEVPEAVEGDLKPFLDWVKEMGPAEAADAYTERIRFLDGVYRTGFIERGLICRDMRDRGLWKLVLSPADQKPYHSMDAWIAGSAPWSRRDCYAAMKAVDELKDIPTETLSQIPQCNLAQLQRMSTKTRREPAVLAAASTLSREQFAAKVEKDYPDQHLEAKSVRWMLSGSLSRLAGEAIDIAMVRWDVKTREEALEGIFADFIASYGVPMQ